MRVFWIFASDRFEKQVSDVSGNGTRFSLPDLIAVDLSDGSDFHCGATEENFVREIELVAGDIFFPDRESQISGNGNHAVPGDPRKNEAGGRSVEHVVFYHKHVFARTFRYESVGIEKQTFIKTVVGGFAPRQN